MSLHEIVLPQTKPETEWVRGRALQKMSPTRTHSMLQKRWLMELDRWSEDARRGHVGAEWRFRVAPPGEVVRPLVPDVAYISDQALPRDTDPAAYEVPLAAPTVAVEILSPDDRPADVEDKIGTYLRAGAAAVIVVDPGDQTVRVHDAAATHVFRPGDWFTHRALPEFALDVRDLFERAKR